MQEISRQQVDRTIQEQTVFNEKSTDISNIDPLPTEKIREKPIAVNSEKNDFIDIASMKGQFGWLEICGIAIPYLIRSDQKYISRRMVEEKLLKDFLNQFTQEVFECYNIVPVLATKVEAALLNEINFKHTNNEYGLPIFYAGTQLYNQDDVVQMMTFLTFCKNIIIGNICTEMDRCGFVMIDGKNSVPFVVVNGKKYLPLFYFDGENDFLRKKSINIQCWDLAYIKMACKVHGIRKELYDNDILQVIDLDLMKMYFQTNNTAFVYCWTNNNTNFHNLVQSTQQQKIIRSTDVNTQNLSLMTLTPGSLLVKYKVCDGPLNAINNDYRIYRVYLDFKYINNCINMLPGSDLKLLVTLEEMAGEYFKVPMHILLNAILQMQLLVYEPNTAQKQLLQMNGFQSQGMILVDRLIEKLNDMKIFFKANVNNFA